MDELMVKLHESADFINKKIGEEKVEIAMVLVQVSEILEKKSRMPFISITTIFHIFQFLQSQDTRVDLSSGAWKTRE